MKYCVIMLILLFGTLLSAGINGVIISDGTIAVSNGASFTVSGALTVSGTSTFYSQSTKACSGATSFPGPEGSLDEVIITPAGDMGSTAVQHYSGTKHPNASTGIKSWWIVNPGTNQNCTITFKVRTTDLTGLTASNLAICERKTGVWQKHTEASLPTVSVSGNYTTLTFTGLNLVAAKGSHELTLGDRDDSTLPVELSSFTAIAIDENNVNIQWRTESESNVLGYNIYRSQEDVLDSAERLNFSVIEGANSSQGQSYSYADKTIEADSYYYWLENVDFGGTTGLYGPVFVQVKQPSTDAPIQEIYKVTKLQGVYPNPFNPETTVSFSLLKTSRVSIKIFNAKGQFVTTLFDDFEKAGLHRIAWNGKNKSGKACKSGIYYVKMHAGDYQEIKRITILK